VSAPIDWVVLGAGLMGRLVACALAERGLRVAVHEAGSADARDSAARIAAAMLAPLAESAITEDSVVQMGRHALQRWPQLIAALDEPVYFQQQGTVVLWHRQDAPEAERLGRVFAATAARIEGLAAPVACDGDALRELEPALGRRFTQGLYLPQEGQLDNRGLLDALGRRMTTLGVALHTHDAKAPQDFDAATALVDCRGLGARAEWPGLRGVRGEVVRLHAPGIGLARPTRLVHPRYPIYIAPKPGDVYVIGATEIESDDRSPPSARSILELLSAAYSVHPGFGEARVLELGAQCRPTLGDNLPALRRLGSRRWQVNGLYRHGFLIAPAVLDALLECLADGHSPLAARLGLRIEEATP
jgi:glycine oxidase